MEEASGEPRLPQPDGQAEHWDGQDMAARARQKSRVLLRAAQYFGAKALAAWTIVYSFPAMVLRVPIVGWMIQKVINAIVIAFFVFIILFAIFTKVEAIWNILPPGVRKLFEAAIKVVALGLQMLQVTGKHSGAAGATATATVLRDDFTMSHAIPTPRDVFPHARDISQAVGLMATPTAASGPVPSDSAAAMAAGFVAEALKRLDAGGMGLLVSLEADVKCLVERATEYSDLLGPQLQIEHRKAAQILATVLARPLAEWETWSRAEGESRGLLRALGSLLFGTGEPIWRAQMLRWLASFEGLLSNGIGFRTSALKILDEANEAVRLMDSICPAAGKLEHTRRKVEQAGPMGRRPGLDQDTTRPDWEGTVGQRFGGLITDQSGRGSFDMVDARTLGRVAFYLHISAAIANVACDLVTADNANLDTLRAALENDMKLLSRMESRIRVLRSGLKDGRGGLPEMADGQKVLAEVVEEFLNRETEYLVRA